MEPKLYDEEVLALAQNFEPLVLDILAPPADEAVPLHLDQAAGVVANVAEPERPASIDFATAVFVRLNVAHEVQARNGVPDIPIRPLSAVYAQRLPVPFLEAAVNTV